MLLPLSVAFWGQIQLLLLLCSLLTPDLFIHSIIRPGRYLLKVLPTWQLVHCISIGNGSSLAHGGGKWAVIYRNRDRRVKVGVTERGNKKQQQQHTNAHMNALKLHTFSE